MRAALQAGQGFPGDRESFESDLRVALAASSESDPGALSAVVIDYRGRIHLSQLPDSGLAVQEGIDLTMRVKGESLSP